MEAFFILPEGLEVPLEVLLGETAKRQGPKREHPTT